MVVFAWGFLFGFSRVPYGQGLNSCAWMGECHNPKALELASTPRLHLTEVHFFPYSLGGELELNAFNFWRTFHSLYVKKSIVSISRQIVNRSDTTKIQGFCNHAYLPLFASNPLPFVVFLRYRFEIKTGRAIVIRESKSISMMLGQ